MFRQFVAEFQIFNKEVLQKSNKDRLPERPH